MRLRGCLAPGVLLLLAACGGSAELLPLQSEVGEDNGRPLVEVRGLTCAASKQEAPYETTCWFELSNSGADDIQCEMSVTGGTTAPSTLSPCRGGEFKVLVREVGPSIVEVRAQREGGSTLSAAIELEGLNSSPTIRSFAAAKKQGTAPLTTALNWEVEDVNSDGISCALEIDGDPVAAVTDCLVEKSFTQSFPSGLHKVRLTATDARGASATSEISVNAVQPVGDVRVVRLEYGQTVLSQTLKLVPGKPAMVRAFVLSDTASLPVVVRLSRMSGGQVLETVAMTGPSVAPTTEDASTLTKSYTYKLPDAWIADGLELKVEADPEDALPETNEDNNALTSKPSVGPALGINVTAVPVMFDGRTASIPDFQPSLTQIFALKTVGRKDRAPYTFTGSFSTNAYDGWSNLLGEIASLSGADGSSDHYFGMIDTQQGGGIGGLGFIGQPAAVGLPAPYIVAHEIGHNLSLPHAPCGPVSGAAGNFPYAGGEIGTYGIDVASMQLVPNNFKDLMGYCQPTWISDFFYKQSQMFLESRNYIAPPPVPPAPMILVAGFVKTNGELIFKPIHKLMTRPTPNEGDALITLHTERGSVEARTKISVEAEEGALHFSALIPDPGELKRVDITVRGKLAGSRAVSSAPVSGEAQLTPRGQKVRVRWDTTKHRSATLAWVNDAQRVTFALDLKSGDAEVVTGVLPVGGNWEVSLSDGLNATRVELAR